MNLSQEQHAQLALFLKSLPNLDIDILQKLSGEISKHIAYKDRQRADNLSREFPNLIIPYEFSIPMLEQCLCIIVESILANYIDQDYRLRKDFEVTDDITTFVKKPYATATGDEGIYPQIVVAVKGDQAWQNAMANLDAGTLSLASQRQRAMAEHPVEITVQTITSYDEANLLAGIIRTGILVNQDIIKNVMKIHQLTFPRTNSAVQTRTDTEIYESTVSFSIIKNIKWTKNARLKKFTNLLMNIKGTVPNDEMIPLGQIFRNCNMKLSPEMQAYIDKLDKENSDEYK